MLQNRALTIAFWELYKANPKLMMARAYDATVSHMFPINLLLGYLIELYNLGSVLKA